MYIYMYVIAYLCKKVKVTVQIDFVIAWIWIKTGTQPCHTHWRTGSAPPHHGVANPSYQPHGWKNDHFL